MKLSPGNCIRSTPRMEDPHFKNATVIITRLDDTGAVGFIVNQPFPRQLHELVEFSDGPPFPLYAGGPVDKEHLFFIHRRPDLVEDSNIVNSHLYEGGNFSAAVRAINHHIIDHADLKIFVGYCGWDTGDLEAEIAEGSWELVECSSETVFA